MGSAVTDGLVHRGIKLVIEGKRYRVDSFLKRSRTLTEEAKAGQLIGATATNGINRPMKLAIVLHMAEGQPGGRKHFP